MKSLQETDSEKIAFEFCKEPLEQVLMSNANSRKLHDAFGMAQEQYDAFGQQVKDNLNQLMNCEKKSETILKILQDSHSLAEFIVKFQIYVEFLNYIKEETKKKLGPLGFLLDMMKDLDKEE